MWPSDQRLEGGMMTYREAEVIHKSKSACSKSNKAARQKPQPGQSSYMATEKRQQRSKTKSKKTMATTWQQIHCPGNSGGQQHYHNTAKLKLEKAMLRHTYIATPAWQQHSH